MNNATPRASGDDYPVITELTVKAAQHGDHTAIGALGADAFRRVTSFYRYTGLTPDAAEDLAADAVELIITRLPSLRSVTSYDAWMWSITRNLLRSWWRSKDQRSVREPITPAPPTPDEQVILHEEHEFVVKALSTLSLKDRELLWLREVVGLDYRSVAQRVDSTPAAVRVSCHRARQRLQSAYSAQEKRQKRP